MWSAIGTFLTCHQGSSKWPLVRRVRSLIKLGEWATVYSNGVIKLDVRLTMKMEDQSLLLVTYSGKFLLNETGLAKGQAGELITSEDCYFITNPLIRTQSESYGWFNSTVLVGKMVSLQPVNENDKPLYVTYDVYQVAP
mgnify:CR=1 FL=1